MYFFKYIKDQSRKMLIGNDMVPREFLDMIQYFRHNDTINFTYHKEKNEIIAESTDFRYGSIVTSGRTQEEVDHNIKDAILTAFGVPAVYAKEAQIVSDKEKTAYAPA